jgi:hypothetical protein
LKLFFFFETFFKHWLKHPHPSYLAHTHREIDAILSRNNYIRSKITFLLMDNLKVFVSWLLFEKTSFKCCCFCTFLSKSHHKMIVSINVVMYGISTMQSKFFCLLSTM